MPGPRAIGEVTDDRSVFPTYLIGGDANCIGAINDRESVGHLRSTRGAGAECVNVNPRGGLCFASCSDAAPCRDGYTCIAHLRDIDIDAKVCVPVAPNDVGP